MVVPLSLDESCRPDQSDRTSKMDNEVVAGSNSCAAINKEVADQLRQDQISP